MLANNRTFRGAVYVSAVVAQVASYFVRAADASGVWAQAVQDTADYLAAIAGVTALSNLSPAPTNLTNRTV